MKITFHRLQDFGLQDEIDEEGYHNGYLCGLCYKEERRNTFAKVFLAPETITPEQVGRWEIAADEQIYFCGEHAEVMEIPVDFPYNTEIWERQLITTSYGKDAVI